MKNYINRYSDFFESKKKKFPNIQKKQIGDFIVYLGKDAKSNDYLTFNIADKEDIWMHVKGHPGSHVVIRIKNKIPTEYVLRQVAELAKKNSKAKGEKEFTVVYCKRKFVKKLPGMNDGQVKVDYVNSYEIKV
jgi:predicted ribosome quality control (RQC) complex YloA/Tae2 family protein